MRFRLETVEGDSSAQIEKACVQTLTQCSQEKRMDMEREFDEFDDNGLAARDRCLRCRLQ